MNPTIVQEYRDLNWENIQYLYQLALVFEMKLKQEPCSWPGIYRFRVPGIKGYERLSLIDGGG